MVPGWTTCQLKPLQQPGVAEVKFFPGETVTIAVAISHFMLATWLTWAEPEVIVAFRLLPPPATTVIGPLPTFSKVTLKPRASPPDWPLETRAATDRIFTWVLGVYV